MPRELISALCHHLQTLQNQVLYTGDDDGLVCCWARGSPSASVAKAGSEDAAVVATKPKPTKSASPSQVSLLCFEI